MIIKDISVSYHWSDNTYERQFLIDESRNLGDLDIPPYLIKALKRYAKELEQSEIKS